MEKNKLNRAPKDQDHDGQTDDDPNSGTRESRFGGHVYSLRLRWIQCNEDLTDQLASIRRSICSSISLRPLPQKSETGSPSSAARVSGA